MHWILVVAAVAVPPAAVAFARAAGASWLTSLAFGALGVLAVYLSSRAPTPQEKAADLGRGVIVTVILTIALAWVQHQGDARSARDSLALTLSSGRSFGGIDLHGRDLHGFYLARKDFGEANLERARLAHAVLRDANLRGSNLEYADLQGADLRRADMRADLVGADLSNANLERAQLEGASVRHADMRGANLAGVNLRRADLRDVDLRDANLLGADLRLAILRADLRGSMLGSDARNAVLTNVILAGAHWDTTTLWPDDFNPSRAATNAARPVQSPSQPPAAFTGTVENVSDGDTIELDHRRTLRLLGINAPQTESRPPGCYADEAKDDLARLLPKGTHVSYTLGARPKDDFQRVLAYVWSGGALINQTLLARGDARILLVPPNVRYGFQLRLTAARAAGADRGLWGACS